jgi:hypothetical protein
LGSVYASLRLAGLSESAAWIAHCTVAAAAAGFVWAIWRGGSDVHAKTSALAAGSVLISPYIYVYDAVMLILPFMWLARETRNHAVLVALWFIPLIAIAQSWGFNETLNLMPAVGLGLLLLVWRQVDAGAPPKAVGDVAAQ